MFPNGIGPGTQHIAAGHVVVLDHFSLGNHLKIIFSEKLK